VAESVVRVRQTRQNGTFGGRDGEHNRVRAPQGIVCATEAKGGAANTMRPQGVRPEWQPKSDEERPRILWTQIENGRVEGAGVLRNVDESAPHLMKCKRRNRNDHFDEGEQRQP